MLEGERMVGPGNGGSEQVFEPFPGSTGTGEAEPAPAGTTPGRGDLLLRRLPPRPAEAQPEQPGDEVLLGRMEGILARTRVFGRSVADFVLGRGATGALRYGVRELAKGIFSWSGAAGVGAGIGAGAAPIGAFAGAVTGAVVEYVRQIKSNLDQRLASEQEADPELIGRRQIFLRKIEGLRHKEAYKADLRKLGKAALFGAVVGAGAGALVEHIPQIAEFIGERVGGLRSVAPGAGEMMGAVGRTIGDTAGDIGHGIGEAAGAAGRTVGDALRGAGEREMAGNIPGVVEYPDLGGGIPQVTTEVAGGARQAAQEAIGQAPDDASALAAAAQEAAKQAKEQALGALTSNHEFLERTAAAVGEQIDHSNLAVDEAIRAAGMDPTQLSGEAYEKIRMSVQHRMEGLANEAFNHAAGSADNLDPSHLTAIAEQGHDEFVASLSGADTHQQLLKVASGTLTEHLTAQQEIVENLSQILHSSPDLATEVMTANGDTVGQMLTDHGYNITWGAADAEVLGAHIAANYDQLSSMWGAMAQVENLPPGLHFPVSLTDLPNLIEQARGGNAEALQKLKDALHWIPAGKKFTILNAEQLTKILAALSKT